MAGTTPTSASPALESWTDLVDAAEASVFPGPHLVHEFAQRLFAFESLQPPTPPVHFVPDAEPYSLQWFVNLENQRHTKHGRWIPKLLEFAKHPGETLLALGDGLGTDWVQYAQHGANVIVCGKSPDQLDLIRRNFQVRGLAGRFLHAQPTQLPLEASAADVACITSLPSGDEAARIVDEVFRVLKPGGKVLAVVPALYHVDYCIQKVCFWRGSSKAAGDCAKWTARQLRGLFHRFHEHHIRKRQLRRHEIPTLMRWLPLPLLARLLGRFLILKAFKPVWPAK